jgi:inner membrane transporter RhtA
VADRRAGRGDGGDELVFYLACDRLPLSTVGAIEFLGTVALATAGARTRRNVLALALAVGGVLVLTDIRISAQPAGFAFAFANCLLFTGYVILGHRIATTRPAGAAHNPMSGIDQLGAAMLIAALIATRSAPPPRPCSRTRCGSRGGSAWACAAR